MQKKSYISCPLSDVLILFTESFTLTGKTHISVPTQYNAIIYIDGRSTFRLSPCIAVNIVKKYGAEYIDREVRVAYIRQKNIDSFPFEIKDQVIENSRLDYDLTASGNVTIEIVNYPRLISVFPDVSCISENDIAQKISVAVSNVVAPIILSGLSETTTEIDIQKTSLEIASTLINDNIFSCLGIRVTAFSLTELNFSNKKL